MDSKTRVLLIGALGNLASLTARKLATRNPEIVLRLTSHRAEGLEQLRDQFPLAEVMHVDWNDAGSLHLAARDVDRVLIVVPDFIIDEAIATPNLIRALEAHNRVQTVLRFIVVPPGLKRELLRPEVLATRAGAMLTLLAKPLFDASKLPVCYLNAACWITFNIGWFYAEDIRKHRQIRMPAATDMPRRWVSDGDLSDAFVRILTDEPEGHVGREYLVAGGPRYTYTEQAHLIGKVLGKDIQWKDDDSTLRRIMGDTFEKMRTYLLHEVVAYRNVPATRQLEHLLGRERTTLSQYVNSISASLT